MAANEYACHCSGSGRCATSRCHQRGGNQVSHYPSDDIKSVEKNEGRGSQNRSHFCLLPPPPAWVTIDLSAKREKLRITPLKRRCMICLASAPCEATP